MMKLFPYIALVTFGACENGTSTGIAIDFEPATSPDMVTAAYTITATGSVMLQPDFEVTRLDALVREVKILTDDDAFDLKLKAKGDFYVDALDARNSIIPFIYLPSATYKKVEFKFEKPKDGMGLAGTDAAIAMDAIIGGISIQLRVKGTDKVTIRDATGIALTNGQTSTFLLDLDVESWFDGVDLSRVEIDADGIARIDDKTNKDAYDQVFANIKTAIKLLRKP